MSLEEKIGQMVMVGFDGPDLTSSDEEFVRRYQVGNVIFLGRNVVDPVQAQSLTYRFQSIASERQHPMGCLLSIDQEGGVVARLTNGETVFPGNMALGATRSEEFVRKAAEVTANEMKALGFNMNLAPVLDINNNPNNPGIGVRSFGEDTCLVTRLGVAAIEAYQGSGVVATAKHFPGKGDVTVDSHLDLPTVPHPRERLESTELAPFAAAIRAGVGAVMTAHVFFPAVEPEPDLPATLSYNVVTRLLREELGFAGVSLTDDLFMGAIAKRFTVGEAAIRAFEAGADIALMCHVQAEQAKAIEAICDAVRAGRISEERVDQSVGRILLLKERYGLLDPDAYLAHRSLEFVGCQENRRLALDIARESVTLLANGQGLIPMKPEDYPNLSVISPDIRGLTQVENDQLLEPPLAIAIRRFAPQARGFTFPQSHGAGQIADAVNLARSSDAVVVGTYNAHLHEEQGVLVRALLDTGVPVVVVAMRNPYDIQQFPTAKAYIAAYGFRECTMQAVAEVIFGVTKPRGRLPVAIPGIHDYGNGLTS
ncbi:MAG: glycoside hydrolase family 3 protein [Clostridia bacterium]|nr:glycoside hydrolase family 3 protein [Clostridia bacterium]